MVVGWRRFRAYNSLESWTVAAFGNFCICISSDRSTAKGLLEDGEAAGAPFQHRTYR